MPTSPNPLEALLAAEPEAFRELLATIPNRVMLIDREARLRAANRLAAGTSAGDDAFANVPEEHRQRLLESLQTLFVTGEPQELEVLGADGDDAQPRWHRVRLFPSTRDGVAVGAAVVFTDLTERREADAQLEQELSVNRGLNRLSGLLIGKAGGIQETAELVLELARELTDSEHGYVSTIDPETRANRGHTLTEMMGDPCQIGQQQTVDFPIGADGKYPSLWGHALNSREPFLTNQPVTHAASRGLPDGHVPLANFATVPVLLGDELVGQIAVAHASRDYAERDLEALTRLGELFALAVDRWRSDENLARLEQQFLGAQKLEAVGRLAGGVAHDINNVLQAVATLASVLELGLEKRDPRLEDVRGILASCERGKALTNALLDFARRRPLALEPLDANQVVREAVKILAHTLAKGIELKTRLAEPPPAIQGDRGELHQVLLNLALNAADAMEDKGTLLFETRRTELTREEAEIAGEIPPGAYVRLRVADTGGGMDEATLARAAEPFFTTKPQGKGTGLGLSTAYGIVTGHGGAMRIISEQGTGTTVSLYLPMADGAPARRWTATHRTVSLAPADARVLLIDDEELIRRALGKLLSKLGYRVTTAASGAKGLEHLQSDSEPPDVVILDLAMPGMDGLETLRAMKAIVPDLKVIIASGYIDEHAREVAGQLGVEEFVPKPFDATIANVIAAVVAS